MVLMHRLQKHRSYPESLIKYKATMILASFIPAHLPTPICHDRCVFLTRSARSKFYLENIYKYLHRMVTISSTQEKKDMVHQSTKHL